MRVGVETRLVMQQKVMNQFMTLDGQLQIVDEGKERIVLSARRWPLLDRWVERTRHRLMIARLGEAHAFVA